MFPEVNTSAISQAPSSALVGTKTYLFDFDTGDFVVKDGKLIPCDGIEAVKVWIEKVIRTEIGRYPIYDGTDYGCHLEDLIIGNNFSAEFVEAELKREIEEALLRNPQITNVSGFTLIKEVNSITVTLEVSIGDASTNTITVTV